MGRVLKASCRNFLIIVKDNSHFFISIYRKPFDQYIFNSKNAAAYYKSLGVNPIMAQMAANVRANLEIKLTDGGFSLTTFTFIKTVVQNFSRVLLFRLQYEYECF